MKKLLIYTGLASILITGCTKNFDEINTNPTAGTPASMDPNLLLSQSQWEHVSATSGYQGPILFQAGWVQIFASTSSGSANYHSNDDKYVASSNTLDYQGRTWNQEYRAASLAFEMKALTDGKPLFANLNNIAVIMKIMAILQVTDIYGDAPYAQALQGKQQVSLPAYDNQQAMYTAMLTELEGAVTKLDATKDKPTSDQFYKGDIAQWKKLGYSLMLKMAMRLTKADAATAKTWAEKAAAGGTFASNADNAIVLADNSKGFGNNNANALRVEDDLYQVRWSKTMIDWLRSKTDPRLSLIAEVPAAGLAANKLMDAGDNDAADQLGLPNGYDLNGGATDVSNSPGYAGTTGSGENATKLGKYSRPRQFYRNQSGPLYVLTYAETELLLAEAAARGWSVGGTALGHYRNGVAGALQSLSAYGSTATIDASVATAYAATQTLPVALAGALQAINEQLWAATGTQLNFVEAWANWKRSGYPVLTPVNYAGNFSGGAIPRRQPYPVTEAATNPENYRTAVGRLTGGDTWVGRVWWDK